MFLFFYNNIKIYKLTFCNLCKKDLVEHKKSDVIWILHFIFYFLGPLCPFKVRNKTKTITPQTNNVKANNPIIFYRPRFIESQSLGQQKCYFYWIKKTQFYSGPIKHFGRGDKNRTRISGFGDRCTAIVLHPYMPKRL